MIIKLNENELMMAANVGVRRQVEALSKGLKNQHGALASKVWQNHIEGACGELAFAKAMNWYWNGSVNTFKLPDVGNAQVRTRSSHSFELIIRKNDTGIFVLVTGMAPQYKVHGWFDSKDVKSIWLQDYGGREKAYFVPQAELHPLESLNAVLI